MIYLPTSFLKPGMVLARNVMIGSSRVPLLVAGQALTGNMVDAMDDRGIKGLYVEYEMSDDVEFEEIIEPEEKQQILSDIKTEFQKGSRPNLKLNYQAVSQMAESVVMNILNSDTMLFNVMDIRDYDNYTYSHSLYVGILGAVMGRGLKLKSNRMNEVATAGILHDIGKLDMPQSIINKPGALSREELALMREHPARGVDRLRGIPRCTGTVSYGVATHHEHFDGTGYPMGLSGQEIPLYGRILAIADVYDALSSKRSYREPWSQTEIVDYITSRSGYQFDQELVTTFLSCITVFPVGTLVRLSNNGIGIVIQNHSGFTLRPTVRFLSPPELRGMELNLAQEGLAITVVDTIAPGDKLELEKP